MDPFFSISCNVLDILSKLFVGEIHPPFVKRRRHPRVLNLNDLNFAKMSEKND